MRRRAQVTSHRGRVTGSSRRRADDSTGTTRIVTRRLAKGPTRRWYTGHAIVFRAGCCCTWGRCRRPADGPRAAGALKLGPMPCDLEAHGAGPHAVSYTHLRAHETRHDLVCRLLLEKK